VVQSFFGSTKKGEVQKQNLSLKLNCLVVLKELWPSGLHMFQTFWALMLIQETQVWNVAKMNLLPDY